MMEKLLGNRQRGLLFVVSAPAGTGKTTLVRKLTAEFPCLIQSISYTTRKPRKVEVEGRHYHFIDQPVFEQKIAANDFLEYANLYGEYYGTDKQWVEGQLLNGKYVILVIDTQGALKLKGVVPAVFIFIQPPSLEELKRRMKIRKTENDEEIELRLQWAVKEMEMAASYDYLIVNEELETAYQILKGIFIAEEHRL